MPHHSKHTQQQRKQADSLIGNSPGGYRQPQLYHNSSTSMDEERINQAMPNWMKQNSSSEDNMERTYHRNQYHRVPSSPPNVTSSGPTAILSGSKEERDSSKKLSRDPSQEIASVLLLAAAAATSDKNLISSTSIRPDATHDIDIVGSHGNRPLKKRKGASHDVVELSGDRKNPDDACHVSPISHSSKSGGTMESNVMSHDTPSTSSSHSLDDTNSNSRVESIQPRAAHMRPIQSMYQMIPQFPQVLHWILSESMTQPPSKELSVDFSVLQWVAHGQAWRIIRWDTFHREVLPAMFPQLSYGEKSIGSIDAFMWQMKAWGFQEIKDGPDIGAFAHTHFRRGHPKMCEEMKFSPTDEYASLLLGSDSRSILRVPSLNLSTPTSNRPSSISDRNDRSLVTSMNIVDYTGSPLYHQTPMSHSSNSSNFLMGQPHELPSYVKYRPEEMNVTPDGNWQLSQKYNIQGNWAGLNGMITSRQTAETRGSSYSPMGIRSSRGGRRHSLGNARPSTSLTSMSNTSPATEPGTTSSRGFPVSNRGIGRRTILATAAMNKSMSPSTCTNDEVVMLADLKASSTTTAPPTETQIRDSEDKIPRSVLKRKQPLTAPSCETEKRSEK